MTQRQTPNLPNPWSTPGIIPASSDQYLYHLTKQPTAWQSLPSAVRFAVWVWTVCMIASVVGAAIFAVLWMLFMASLGNS